MTEKPKGKTGYEDHTNLELLNCCYHRLRDLMTNNILANLGTNERLKIETLLTELAERAEK